ncbi:Aste57867_24520 [Aphanomyces stellatus]|uniref:subtilisin n=1 Tax=Aphanomyces stellatus TaxID=120398 RepID=A0A485LUY4_9STRA|nr:hypothetical protein As57867_024443 [Aphanomyces stellatus]VFU01159.1 Aste57867_24520 [Aphanomyces stellatus]
MARRVALVAVLVHGVATNIVDGAKQGGVVSPIVHQHLESASTIDVLVTFEPIASLAASVASAGRDSTTTRASRVRTALKAHATMTQKPLDDLLFGWPTTNAKNRTNTTSIRFGSVRHHYIANMVTIKGATPALIDQIAVLPGVQTVIPEPVLHLSRASASDAASQPPQWGVIAVNAPSAWAAGATGAGVVVGSIDTGVRATHEALAGNWRQDHGWYDPTNAIATPYDDDGHGTHTLGTAVGTLGIGVAPGAQWIACRGCPAGSCPASTLLACAEFMLCPTDAAGQNSNCALHAHVVSNSWGGSSGQTFFDQALAAWRQAGIVPVFSNGNAGPSCATVAYPSESSLVIAAGAIDADNSLGSFSSKGPSSINQQIKPDVAAPGVAIVSAATSADNAYKAMSGTSMAAPHVAGTVALLLSVTKGLTFDQIYKLVTTTTATTKLVVLNSTCNSVVDTTYPNNNYGYGLVDANHALAGSKRIRVAIATRGKLFTGQTATFAVAFLSPQPFAATAINQEWIVDATAQMVNLAGTSFCLDGYEGFNGGTVHLWPCSPTNANQKWSYDPTTRQLRHATFVGFCLDFDAHAGVTHLWSCLSLANADIANQQFDVNAAVQVACQGKLLTGVASDVTYALASTSQVWLVDTVLSMVQLEGTTLCLDGYQGWNGGAVHLWPCDPTNGNQKWTFDTAANQLRHATYSGYCLDFANDGVRPYLWTCVTTADPFIANQKLQLLVQY